MTTPCNPGFLGYSPTVEPLMLTTGASFVQTLQPSGAAGFPAGTTVALVFTAPGGAPVATWPATVTATTASWAVSNAVCDPIPAGTRYTMLVTYPTSPVTSYAWYEGIVVRT